MARRGPSEQEVVIWDDSLPLEEKRAILRQADDPTLPREEIDLSSPDSSVYFRPSGDRSGAERTAVRHWRATPFGRVTGGTRWETVPTRINPPSGLNYVHIDGGPWVQYGDGTQLVVASIGSDAGNTLLGIYGTDNNGLSWDYIAEVASDPTGRGRPTYAVLLPLPSGRLQCYMLNIQGLRNAIQMNYSDDGGYSWSVPRPIVAWGQSPWAGLTRTHVWSGARRQGVHYRSPWPLRLRDGRIVVIFGRRQPPFGMGLIVSEDDGATWSAEAVIRADASEWDLGYPVATELDDGRIFTAYYYHGGRWEQLRRHAPYRRESVPAGVGNGPHPRPPLQMLERGSR